MNSKKVFRILASLLLAIAAFFFIITFSIGLPIYLRPFYYAHINAMDLPSISGHSYGEIKEAYDEVLDYLTLPNKEFSAGIMRYSEEGAAHFADCKVLFDLNASVLFASATVIALLLIVGRRLKITYRLGKRSSAFWAAVSAIVFPIIIGTLAATNFDRAFVIFHSIFFPGKENWIFDPKTDEIITVLPQDFFMDCAILIGVGVVVLCTAIICTEFVIAKKNTANQPQVASNEPVPVLK